MTNLPFENLRHNNILKFSENKVPINERFAIIYFSDFKNLIDDILVFRNALYCFFLIKEGNVEIDVNGLSKNLKRGDLICGIPGDTWTWKSRENLNGVFIFFEAPFILASLKGGFSLEPISYMNSDSHYPFIRLTGKRLKKLSELADDMYECLNEVPVFYDLIRTQLWQFIFLAEKEYIANGHEGRKQTSMNYVPVFINLVNNHFRISHDTTFYADKMNITSNYLNKIVKNALGTNAREFIINRIMSEAKLLLRLTETNISELAYKLGFKDPNYFIRCFKKSEGITPKEYQKRGTL